MIGAAAVRRRELALAALVATAGLLLLVVTVDAVRFHLPDLLRGREFVLDAHTGALAVLLVAEAVILCCGARSLARQLSLQRRLETWPVLDRHVVGGYSVDVVASGDPVAFCAGLIRPRVCVSIAALERLDAAGLEAVVAHEACHVRRRDPLRLAMAHVVADGFGFLAPMRWLTDRQASVADLAADAAAVQAVGSPQPLAAAMLSLQDPAPERVDQLAGQPLPVASRGLIAAAGGAVAALGTLAFGLLLAAEDPTLPLLVLPVIALPAVFAVRASR